MTFIKPNRQEGYRPEIFWFCLFAFIWTTFLLFAGGFTTSIDAGMAFLDWPLSNGSINPEGWTVQADMMAEHSHRLLGMKIGLLSIALVILTWYRESRKWARRLAWIVLLVVVLQGFLGGARVLFDRLNTGAENNTVAQSFAVLHACGAQITLCLLVSLAAVSSRIWHEANRYKKQLEEGGNRGVVLRALCLAGCLFLFLTILMGAVMRHANVGMAIPSFPLSSPDGHLLPPHWNWAIVINFLHRFGALVSALIIILLTGILWQSRRQPAALKWLTSVTFVLLLIQVLLGGLVIWTGINEHAATVHMVTGAFLMASQWLLTLFTFKLIPVLSTRKPLITLKETETARA